MLKLIDTKAIAREQNALKRKFDKVIDQANELPMSDAIRGEMNTVFEEAFKEQSRLIIEAAFNNPQIVQGEFELENIEEVVL
jgi:hypothetical protein